MRAAALAAALVLVAATLPPAPAAGAARRCAAGPLAGPVTHVRDGDTIEVAGVPVRLQGLAAPERREPGGAEATAAMRAHEAEVRRDPW